MPNTEAADTGRWDTAAELIGVTKYFDQKRPSGFLKQTVARVTALDDLSLSIGRGEFVAYAGPNGAGKSTTFRLLCGMLAPQRGQVRVFGQEPMARRIPLMRRVGVLFGNRSELWYDHPVISSFRWKKAVWDIPDDVYQKALSAVTELLELEPLMNTFSRELSLGQRMRADLGLMLLHRPELILLDEPTLGLDVLAKRQMIAFLKKINREERATILVTSHDMDDLNEMANRIALIHRGKLAFDGAYDALLKSVGDWRVLRLSAPGPAPSIDGAQYQNDEDGRHVYRYDAAALPAGRLMARLAEIPGIADVETSRAPIEQVVAELYGRWR